MRHILLILTALDNPFVFGLVLVFSIVLFFAILILVVKIWTERSQDKYTAMARDRKNTQAMAIIMATWTAACVVCTAEPVEDGKTMVE